MLSIASVVCRGALVSVLPCLSPDALRLLSAALLATESPKRLRKMRRYLESRLPAPGVIVLGAEPDAIQGAVILLAVAEREAKARKMVQRL